jgi:hypothetical protein
MDCLENTKQLSVRICLRPMAQKNDSTQKREERMAEVKRPNPTKMEFPELLVVAVGKGEAVWLVGVAVVYWGNRVQLVTTVPWERAQGNAS